MRYMRWVAKAVVFSYVALAIAVLAGVTAEGDGDVLVSLLVIAVPLLAACLYCVGLAKPSGERGRIFRVLGWVAMVGGSIALISFSFVIWPLLLLAAPYSFLRDDNQV